MIRHLIRSGLLTACLLYVGMAEAHGPTMCLGMVTRNETSATLDLRLGVGLVHGYIDPDDNAVVTPEEWTSGSVLLKRLLHEELLMAHGDRSSSATRLEIAVNDASEIRVDADFAWAAIDPKPELTLPFLKRLSGLPPAILSVWEGQTMIAPPTVVFFYRKIPLFQ